MASTWKSKTSVFERKFISKMIGNNTWNFYPVSVGRIFELRETIKDIFMAATALFSKNKDDVGQQIERIQQGESTIDRTNIDGLSPQMAEMCDKQKKQAVADAVESLLSERNKLMIGKLLADSLRDEFERNPSDTEINEFIGTLDLASLVEFLMGMAEANAKVFGPVGERIRDAIGSKLRLVVGESPANKDEASAAPSTPSEA